MTIRPGRVVATVLFCFISLDAKAEAPVVPVSREFILNDLTIGDQHAPAVVATAGGEFLITWTSKKSVQDYERIYLRSATCPRGVGKQDVLVQATEIDASSGGSLLAHTEHGVLAVWSENFLVRLDNTRDYSVVAQGFTKTAIPLGVTFRPLASKQGNEFEPALAPITAGDFALVWQDFNVEPGESDQASRIRWQRVDVQGQATSMVTDAAPYSATGLPINPSVTVSPNGEFTTVWQELGKDGDGDGIILKRFASGGEAIEPAFIVNSTTVDAQEHPKVLSGPDSTLFVVWESHGQDGSGSGIFGQFLDSSGARVGGEFQVNQQTIGDQIGPRATLVPGLGLLVTWRSYGQDGDGYGAFARAFSWGGSPLGDEFQLNSSTIGDQQEQDAASDLFGNILFVWASPQDGDKRAVIGRFFAANVPVCGDAWKPSGCRGITVTDAFVVLRAVVAEGVCPPCVCDTDGSGSMNASDALMVLRAAVGLPGTLSCPICETSD